MEIAVLSSCEQSPGYAKECKEKITKAVVGCTERVYEFNKLLLDDPEPYLAWDLINPSQPKFILEFN